MYSRRYSELVSLPTFEERYRYLQLRGTVAYETFGFDRYLNQKFYRSNEWKKIRDQVIVRDMGCDLGLKGYEISGKIIVHHMNPITIEDIDNNPQLILNPEFLICTSMDTHNAIHYGDEKILHKYDVTERSQYDTLLWRYK